MYLPKGLINLRKFGRVPLTGKDFIEMCNACDVEIVLSADASRGFYYFAHGKHTIVLSTRLSAAQRRFIGWHEFAHFLQNFHIRKPVAAFSNVQPDQASEKLADVFAAIAVNPYRMTVCSGLDFVNMLMNGKS